MESSTAKDIYIGISLGKDQLEEYKYTGCKNKNTLIPTNNKDMKGENNRIINISRVSSLHFDPGCSLTTALSSVLLHFLSFWDESGGNNCGCYRFLNNPVLKRLQSNEHNNQHALFIFTICRNYSLLGDCFFGGNSVSIYTSLTAEIGSTHGDCVVQLICHKPLKLADVLLSF